MSADPMDGSGLPVEIGDIGRELGKLWEEAGESKTRASLLNLVLYTEDPREVAANTGLVAELATEHACRAIVILAEPRAPECRARAWINAHCHLAGKREICSEQISFHLEGEAVEALPGVVFSHLDSDLPLCLWWQADFPERPNEKLWAWVDRLLFDSAKWASPAKGFAATREIAKLGDRRTVLADLNWARLLGIRFALAGLFDAPSAISAIPALTRARIGHAPGNRTTALLLLGWLASHFGWRVADGSSRAVSPEGNEIAVELFEEAYGESGAAISFCELSGGGFAARLKRPGGVPHYETEVAVPGCPVQRAVVPAGKEAPRDLILAELARGGRHGQYREAAAAVFPAA